MDGGTVTIEWDEASGHILMTGPATKVFDGEFEEIEGWGVENEELIIIIDRNLKQ